MVDEADVNEAMAGPPSRKRPPPDNRQSSPRDRKRQHETPVVRWPSKSNQNGANQPTLPVNNKITLQDKNSLPQEGKTNNIFPGYHGIKRKHSDAGEGHVKLLKPSKGLMRPQLARLQQRHQNKGRLNKTHHPVPRVCAVNSSKNDFVSSILKEAVTSQSRTFSGQGQLQHPSKDSVCNKQVGMNKDTNLEIPEILVDSVEETRGKGPSPGILKKHLAREAWEENIQIRNRIFKEIRQPIKSEYYVCYYRVFFYLSLSLSNE